MSNPLIPATKHHGTEPENLEKALRDEVRVEKGLGPRDKVTNAEIEQQLQRKLAVINNWMTKEKLEEKLDKANLNHIGIYEGIMYDKLLALRGQPSNIISVQHQKKMDEVMPALLEEMKRRGLKAELTERKVMVEVPPE